MLIAYDHQVFVQQRYGGISRYFAELTAYINSRSAHQARIVAPFHQNEYLLNTAVAPAVLGRHLRPIALISLRSALRWANRCALPWAWRGLRPDIVHETSFSTHAIGHGRVRLLTVYDMIHELFGAALVQSDRQRSAKRAAIERADHIVCISESTRQDLLRLLPVDAARTSVIHLGHALTEQAAPPAASAVSDASAAAPPPPATAPYLLFVGDRSAYKNFERLLQAYAEAPRLRTELRLLAFGGRPFTRRELALMAQLGIGDRVAHEGGSDRQLAERYRGARLYVCPSTYEGFGLPPLEAMAHGTPVAVSRAGSLPEVAGDAAEYFDALDTGSMGAALERVAFDEARRTALIAAGGERIKAFSWERCAVETLALYERLVR